MPDIPGYRLVRCLGAGGMGCVYLAVQQSLNRSVVIKVLTRSTSGCQDDLTAHFEREAVLMAHGSHPNVVGVVDRGTVDGKLYIVMEYMEGGDLRSRLQRDRPMPVSEARPILSSIGLALAALHEKGIVHRDLKPENVLFDQAGIVRLADFGIAAPLEQIGELTPKDFSPGTLDYMAPEQRYRLGIDARVDQYGLACIAHEMLTGRRPLGPIRPPSERNSRLTRTVDEVVLRGLAEDPDDRFPTVAEFSKALDESLAACPALFGSAAVVQHRLGRIISAFTAASGLNRLERLPRRVALFGTIVVLGAIAGIALWHLFFGDGPDAPVLGMPNGSSQPDVIEQAGILGYRVQDGEMQVLLVRSREDTHWTIPKGTQNRRATPEETAVEEAFEEGGVQGQLGSSPVGCYHYSKKGERYRVTVFPFLVEQELSTWPEQFRERQWRAVDAAAGLVAEKSLGDLISGFRPPAP